MDIITPQGNVRLSFWHGRNSGNTATATKEFEAYRNNFKSKPSRFKLEAAMNKECRKQGSVVVGPAGPSSWDFGQSLWDSYEIVTLSKRLEAGLVLGLDHPIPMCIPEDSNHQGSRKRKESKNSLRSLFNRFSSRRFDHVHIPRDDHQF
uniref:Uncharacterized protein n=1 Tax=Nelumbo nucifera TaxID=4432 RepID=A0A822YE11_NELNU|nr:TPA_asm: hypothetical protein HUJ06_009641 [Nelumbo nucifera]